MNVSHITAKLAKEIGFDENCQKQFYVCGKLTGFTGYDIMKNYNKNSSIHNITHENYDGDNFENYHSDCTAPLQSYLQKWIRDNFNIRIFPTQKVCGDYGIEIYSPNKENPAGKPFNRLSPFTNHYPTYEDALENGILETLKIIKNEQ